MYDKYVGVPEAGSWLESLFFVVWSKRQEQLSSQAWFAAVSSLPTDLSEKRLEAIMSARTDYTRTLYPFQHEDEKDGKAEQDEEHEALELFAKKKAKIDLRPVMRATIEQRKAVMRRTAGLPRVRKRPPPA